MNIFSLLLIYALMTILIVSLIGIILFFLRVAIRAKKGKRIRKSKPKEEMDIPF